MNLLHDDFYFPFSLGNFNKHSTSSADTIHKFDFSKSFGQTFIEDIDDDSSSQDEEFDGEDHDVPNCLLYFFLKNKITIGAIHYL